MAQKDLDKKAIALHKKLGGKIRIAPARAIKSKDDMSLVYTPGVAAVSSLVAKNPKLARDYTIKGKMIAVVSDGSAVLGLGNIGSLGALPVMEGKCALFKTFADVDAFPLVLDTQDPDKIIEAVMAIAPAFGGINLEDIAAPKCFYIEDELKKRLNIPVMHDDQHGTAIVVLAGLINAAKVAGKKLNDANCWMVVSGVGAAGVAIMRLIKLAAPKVNIIAVDSEGIVWEGRKGLNDTKKKLIKDKIVFAKKDGDLGHALVDANVFIGVSKPNVLTGHMIHTMAPKPIIFAMANPNPEVDPVVAHKAGALVVATGRSDYPNQINNSLAFPGIFRGALDNKVQKITDAMKIKAAHNLAALVKHPTPAKIIPGPFESGVALAVAKAIR
ncbi:MAG TPA: NADP-dependent malic enzyme [Candidatus Paceibacterota bacterium]|jgi:malate dehydrogenase (oxaloacetate-decarboxylating)|nr:NADP-dependent malic enzyme [Candidatus Paceibacterota bacterium]